MFPLPWLLHQAKSSLRRFREVVCFLKGAENAQKWIACGVQVREAGTKSTSTKSGEWGSIQEEQGTDITLGLNCDGKVFFWGARGNSGAVSLWLRVLRDWGRDGRKGKCVYKSSASDLFHYVHLEVFWKSVDPLWFGLYYFNQGLKFDPFPIRPFVIKLSPEVWLASLYQWD